jgi:DNA replication ATP-dependent helicase Dna2
MICGGTFILAGDHKQLPPILHAHEPDEPVAMSIFEHLVNCYPALNLQLDVTYRMNREINEFSSSTFYEKSLLPAPEAASRSFSALPIYGKPDYLDDIICRKESVTFVEVDHKLCSTMSKDESDIAAQLALRLMLDHHLPASELAIISPHRQHNREIRSQLRKLLVKENSLAVKSILDQISIDTVEKMQGREREVVILSLCASKRSYLEYRASFLYKPNRLNVAITRCRTRLFVLASKQFFPCNNKVRINPRHAQIFNDYYQYLERRKVVGTIKTDALDEQFD